MYKYILLCCFCFPPSNLTAVSCRIILNLYVPVVLAWKLILKLILWVVWFILCYPGDIFYRCLTYCLQQYTTTIPSASQPLIKSHLNSMHTVSACTQISTVRADNTVFNIHGWCVTAWGMTEHRFFCLQRLDTAWAQAHLESPLWTLRSSYQRPWDCCPT